MRPRRRGSGDESLRLGRSSALGAVAVVASLVFIGAAQGATVTGTVSWSEPFEFPLIVPSSDRHVCGRHGPIHAKQVRFDAAGRVQGAIVYLPDAPEAPAGAPGSLLVDQKNCQFVPRVATLPVGSKVTFTSSDPILHTVHLSDDSGRTLASWAMPVMGQRTQPRTLTVPGLYRLRCEAGHRWMNAHLWVFGHPFFAQTTEAGRFELVGVPQGRHRVLAWHPDLGITEGDVTVDGDRAQVALAF